MEVDERIGELFPGASPWRADAILGYGATSVVYATTRLRDGTRGALKLFREDLTRHARVLKLLLQEARLVAAIEHPGTVKVLDEGITADGCTFLVFELLIGGTLDELRKARGGRVPLEEVMPIGDAVMQALAAVHAAGIVHRDLKPANIFILEGGGVKLLDFGFGKMRGYTADAAQNVVGTPSFMPPEAALGMTKKVDIQSDVWSLGATLFNILSGQPVHIASHMEAMMLASASTKPRSLADAAPELPSKIVSVIDRALAYRKADRFRDLPEMQAAWKEAHPDWLPTLPPPSFHADPAFLDSNLLVPADSVAPEGLFHPRELLDPIKPRPKHPGPIPPKRAPRS